MVDFAQGEILMLGAYAGLLAVSNLMLPFYLSLVFAALAIGAVGALIERTIYRRLTRRGGGMTVEGLSVIACAIGVSVFLQNLAWLIWKPISRPFPVDLGEPIQVGGVSYSPLYFWILGIGLGLMIAVQIFLKRTKWGRAIRAVAHNKEVAYLLGINVGLVISGIFALASAMSAVAGVLVGPINFVRFDMGTVVMTKGFAASVVGGFGSIPGAILGGFVLALAETFGAGFISSGYKDVIGFGVMILVLYLRPEGLFVTLTKEKA
jgi:branched-chain amino acid transport system permease protein